MKDHQKIRRFTKDFTDIHGDEHIQTLIEIVEDLTPEELLYIIAFITIKFDFFYTLESQILNKLLYRHNVLSDLLGKDLPMSPLFVIGENNEHSNS